MLSKHVAKPKRKYKMCPFLWFWFRKTFVARTRVRSVRATCVFAVVLYWFLLWSRLGAFGSPGIDFVYSFKMLFLSFWTPKSQYRWECIGNRCLFLKALGMSFSMFLQVVKIMTISVTIYNPKCSQTLFGDPGASWASLGGSLVAPRDCIKISFAAV